jgi:DNA repair protein RadA/Sms
VKGSVTLLGGDPGIGKSTLALQLAAKAEVAVLYVSGEESSGQIRLRAERLGVPLRGDLLVSSENEVDRIIAQAQASGAGLLIVDSIQTIRSTELNSAAASVSQLKACTEALTRFAKADGIPVIIIGHVTKEGAIAGPRALEHIVDTVLYFEGDGEASIRIVRAVKNRFGATDEVAVFEMRDDGLAELSNPSSLFCPVAAVRPPGCCATIVLEGTRPLAVEIQALVSPSAIPVPRRQVVGLDLNRVQLILAVLEKRAGFALGNKDVYISVVGGLRIREPAADLAVAMAVGSSLADVSLQGKMLVFGEVSLSGEVRRISRAERRLRESSQLGFAQAIIPAGTKLPPGPLQVHKVHSVADAIRLLPRHLKATPQVAGAGPHKSQELSSPVIATRHP